MLNRLLNTSCCTCSGKDVGAKGACFVQGFIHLVHTRPHSSMLVHSVVHSRPFSSILVHLVVAFAFATGLKLRRCLLRSDCTENIYFINHASNRETITCGRPCLAMYRSRPRPKCITLLGPGRVWRCTAVGPRRSALVCVPRTTSFGRPRSSRTSSPPC